MGTVLHTTFTMNCYPAGTSRATEGPRSWELSSRAIDGFCTVLLKAGYQPTLFATPECAGAHSPLLDDLVSSGVEVGLLIHPPSLEGAKLSKHFGQLPEQQQRKVVQMSVQQFGDRMGYRPLSVRTALFSANDSSFAVLSAFGFLQSSLSNPGRRMVKQGVAWTGALTDAHYTSATDRLAGGALPLWELPVTSDAVQERGGIAPDLCIDSHVAQTWHRPLVDAQLQRMSSAGVAFRALCLYTRNAFSYERTDGPARTNLEHLITYLEELESSYQICPLTLGAAHQAFHHLQKGEQRDAVG
ncbi:MAG: hypothetical protein M1118_06485 [Chloroflexi bacterium]|nr:hypothetical protein [Chloroflexota bacterium]